MFKTRLLTALVGIPIVLVAVYFGGWYLTLLLTALSMMGVYEMRRIMKSAGIDGFWPAAFVAAPLFVLDAQVPEFGLARLALVLVVVVTLTWMLGQGWTPQRAVLAWTVTIASAVYVGWLMGFMVLVRNGGHAGTAWVAGPLTLQYGAAWLLFAFGVSWVCDAAAYGVGRLAGRRPFYPAISPKKTLEGTLGGLAAAALAGAWGGLALDVGWLFGLALGAICGFAGVFGDLSESLLKRAGGVKDSGSMFPGHGGLLDRIDSLLFVVVAVYYGMSIAEYF